jgi:DNA-binding MarR family transcriptional regulator
VDPFLRSDKLRAWRLFLESYRGLVDALEHELQGAKGLPLSFYDVLVQLHEAPEQRLRMNELASSVLLSRSGLTRLIDRMESAGLVERSLCSDDRRGSFAVLTDRGREAFRDAAPVHIAGVKRHFADHLTDAEARTLIKALTKLAGERSAAAGDDRPA